MVRATLCQPPGKKGHVPATDLEERRHEQHLQQCLFSPTSPAQQPQGSFPQQYYLLCLVYRSDEGYKILPAGKHQPLAYTIKLYLVCVWFKKKKKVVKFPLFSFYFLRKLSKPTILSHGNMPWSTNYFIPSYSEMCWSNKG